ncbi:hypothetical protein Hanom_Chr01g00086701 [Helianthus anomalus]
MIKIQSEESVPSSDSTIICLHQRFYICSHTFHATYLRSHRLSKSGNNEK